MTNQQIKELLISAGNVLRTIQEDSNFQAVINSDTFTTSNDLTLSDAIQAISEVWHGILNHEEIKD